MRVSELKALLKKLPDDAEVLMDSCGSLSPAEATPEKAVAVNKSRTQFLLRSAGMSDTMKELANESVLVFFRAD